MTTKYFQFIGLAVVLAMPSSLAAATFDFTSRLDSAQASSQGASDAWGEAQLSVDSVTESLSFALTVIGISLDDLADAFVDGANAALGPIHLHDGDLGQNGPVVVPFPFDSSYSSSTSGGFQLVVDDYAYADAVAISGSTLSFDEYLADLQRGGSYINVHTDAYVSGEIRGQLSPEVAPVPLPAGLPLLLASLGGLAFLRRKR